MSQKKKLVLVCILLLFLAVVAAFILYSNRGWKLDNETAKKSSMEDILFYEVGQKHQNSMCLIIAKDNRGLAVSKVIPGRYITFQNFAWERYYSEDTGMSRIVSLVDNVQPYNVVTEKFESVIDVKKLMENHTPSSYEIYHSDAYVLEKDKKYYLYRRIVKDKFKAFEGVDAEWGMYVNIETGEVLLEPWEEREVKNYTPREAEVDTSLVQERILLEMLLGGNGFAFDTDEAYEQGTRKVKVYYTTFEGTLQIVIEPQTLPRESDMLYREFPELKTYHGGEDERVTLYLSGYPKAEDIMKMLLGDGKEISFEGCVLSAKDSKDGQDHKIGSFEEYYQWVKESFEVTE